MADEDALLNMQLAEEVFQIAGHGLVGQHGGVGAVAVVTGIYSQHLTGQRMVERHLEQGTRGNRAKTELFAFRVSVRPRRSEAA